MGSAQEYDMVVIGSGPGGQKAAIASAKLGKSVAVVERGQMLGGVCVQTGTIPSKTLREAVLYLTGMSQRDFYIICPDNDVTREIDNRRILWAAQDITENRPALSRWHADYSAAFEQFLRGN